MFKTASLCLCVCAAVAGGLRPGAARAQSSSQDNTTVSVNYVYAFQLGIGSYEVGGLSVDVFTLPLSITLPLAETFGMDPPVDNAEDWRIRFKLFPGFGIFGFKDNDPDFGRIHIKQYTLSLTPGVELIAPVNDVWTLKPFVDAGFGKAVASSGRGAGGDNAFATYTAGLRSLVELPAGDYRFALGNGAVFAGNTEFGGDDSEAYWAIETGVQARRSLGFSLADLGVTDPDRAGVTPEAGLYFIHYYFPKALQFSRFRDDPLKVRNQFEFGLTLGSATPWELFTLPNPRIGASYIFGDDLEVVRVNFGFPF